MFAQPIRNKLDTYRSVCHLFLRLRTSFLIGEHKLFQKLVGFEVIRLFLIIWNNSRSSLDISSHWCITNRFGIEIEISVNKLCGQLVFFYLNSINSGNVVLKLMSLHTDNCIRWDWSFVFLFILHNLKRNCVPLVFAVVHFEPRIISLSNWRWDFMPASDLTASKYISKSHDVVRLQEAWKSWPCSFSFSSYYYY